MQQKIFAIYDAAAEAYLTPFFQHNEAMAIRAFGTCAASDDHQFGLHPEDYTLMYIGDYYDESGEIQSALPTKVISALEARNLYSMVPSLGDKQANGRIPFSADGPEDLETPGSTDT